MSVPKAIRYRGRDAARWTLTSIAASLLVHMLVMHYLGGVRLLDVEHFTASVSRWFSVVEIPQTNLPPDLKPLASEMPEQVDRPAKADPTRIPLAAPDRARTQPGLATDERGPAGAHQPSRTRLPGTTLPVLHHRGPPVLDQTLAQLGEVAPVRVPTRVEKPTGPGGEGRVRVASGSPALPATPAADVPLPAARAHRPTIAVPAGPLAPPTVKPTLTPVHRPAEAPPAGIVIPLEPTIARQETQVRKLIIEPIPSPVEPTDARPIIPFGDEVGVNCQMYAEPGNPRYYFRFEISVAKPEKLPVIPKDVLFICDVSLSIRTQELRITREAIAEHLRRLKPGDRFNVVVFSEEARKLFKGFAGPTPERIRAAARFIARIRGQIRTDVYRVLRAVVRDIATQSHRKRPCHLYFISDGASTAGIRDVKRIVDEISALARPNFAIFPFDAGKGGNRYLLDLLAYRSRGAFTFTNEIDEAPKLLTSLFRSFDSPVLMNLQTLYANLNADEIYPASIPNLYADQPVVIYGRCTPGQNVSIKLQGKNPSARRALHYQAVPGAPDPSRSDIAREWARRKIHHLTAELVHGGDTRKLKAEIKQLGTKYDIPTPYSR